MSEEKTVQMTDKEFFNNFISSETETQSMRIAKAQDQIDRMTERIKSLSSQKDRDSNTLKACEAVIKSQAYPALSPIVSAVKDLTEKSMKSKDKKISNAEKKIKRAEQKIKKAQNKLKKVHMIRDFMDALKNSENKQTALIDGVRTLKEDSLQRSENRLYNISIKIDSLKEKLNSPDLGNADRLKVNKRIEKLESKKEKLNRKIDNLNGLEQRLDNLSKIELTDEMVRELADSAIETAEKAVAETGDISSIIDEISLASYENIESLIERDMDMETEDPDYPTKEEIEKYHLEEVKPSERELKDMEIRNKEKMSIEDDIAELNKLKKKDKENKSVSFPFDDPVKREVTSTQLKKLADAGVNFIVGKDNGGKLYAVFDNSDLQKVNKALEPKKKQSLKK